MIRLCESKQIKRKETNDQRWFNLNDKLKTERLKDGLVNNPGFWRRL